MKATNRNGKNQNVQPTSPDALHRGGNYLPPSHALRQTLGGGTESTTGISAADPNNKGILNAGDGTHKMSTTQRMARIGGRGTDNRPPEMTPALDPTQDIMNIVAAT